MPSFTPESSRLAPAGRVARVVLGFLAALAGLAGGAAAFLLVVDVIANPTLAPTPGRAAGAAGLGLGIAGLFGALAVMGMQRIVAGVRGWRVDLGLHLHGSRASKVVFGWGAGACMVAGLGLSGTPAPFRWLAVPLLGMAYLSVPLLLLIGAPEHACSMCGTARRRLGTLLAGEAASICEGCARFAMKTLAQEAERKGRAEAWCDDLIQLLPERCPRGLSRAFVERLTGRDRTSSGLRHAAQRALDLGNEPLARELLEELPEAERQPVDWLNLGVALADLDRDADALAATERAAGVAALRPWVLNNAVWFRTQLQPDASAAERTRWLAEVEEAQRLLAEAHPHGWQRSMGWFRGTEAEVRRLSGDLEGALAALARAEAEHPLAGEHLARRARVLADLGRMDEDRGELERALALLHPEGKAAADARALLASLTPPAAAASV